VHDKPLLLGFGIDGLGNAFEESLAVLSERHSCPRQFASSGPSDCRSALGPA
jgi:hypothetical protein